MNYASDSLPSVRMPRKIVCISWCFREISNLVMSPRGGKMTAACCTGRPTDQFCQWATTYIYVQIIIPLQSFNKESSYHTSVKGKSGEVVLRVA